MKKITNKIGFTLIELLAVIVILAIIALIAAPIVMNSISDSKKAAAEQSAENYIKQINTKAASLYANPDTRLVDGVYYVTADGNLCFGTLSNEGASCVESSPIAIEMNGTKPTSGTVAIENSKVVSRLVIDSNIHVTNFNTSEYTFTYVENRKIRIVPQKICTLKSGEPLAIGSKYECEVGEGITQTFYVLEDGDSETKTSATDIGDVSLIMDSNINREGFAVKSSEIDNRGLEAWISSVDYLAANKDVTACEFTSCIDEGPITALNYLNIATLTWANVEVSLPTGQQIANAGNNITWTPGGSVISGLPSWLYDYLDSSSNSVSRIYGYWTSTPTFNNYIRAWIVYYNGNLTHINVSNDTNSGIRPVITISKSSI